MHRRIEGILFHIPNRYFNLEPAIAHIARDLGAYAATKEAQQDGITLHTFWAVVTWDQPRYLHLINDQGWKALDANQTPKIRTWSDDYSSVLPVLRWDQFTGALTHFKPFKLKKDM